MLLAEHRKTELLIQEQDIIPIAVGIKELEDGMAMNLFSQEASISSASCFIFSLSQRGFPLNPQA